MKFTLHSTQFYFSHVSHIIESYQTFNSTTGQAIYIFVVFLVDTVYPDELEEYVSECLYNEFDIIVEDGTCPKVNLAHNI